jgi:hypothetical protein
MQQHCCTHAVPDDTAANCWPVVNSYTSKTDIYQGRTTAGWFPYGDSYSRYAVPGGAPQGIIPCATSC